ERFCRLGFETIAGHRPEMHIEEAPNAAGHVPVAHLWSSPLEDAYTALPEPRRPAPPFPERVTTPRGVAAGFTAYLLPASAERLKVRAFDSRHHFPILLEWDAFASLEPVRHRGEPRAVPPARWAAGTAEAFSIPAWARPQTRGARRMPSQFAIRVRNPMFTGPAFIAGKRRTGPSSAMPAEAPVFVPATAKTRPETVMVGRAAILPISTLDDRSLGAAGMLESACRIPVGRTSAHQIVHPASEILLAVKLPSEYVEITGTGALYTLPAVRQSGVSVDIGKGSPKLAERELLEKFRRR